MAEFKIPISRFDTNLLPPEARQVGTEAFKTAVVMHFAAEYAAQGQTAMVTVDDEEITVMAFPATASALDFVMPMLRSGRIAEAVPYLESLTKSAPADAAVLYNLGIAYSELGQYDEAIIRLKRAVQLDPGHAHAAFERRRAAQRSSTPDATSCTSRYLPSLSLATFAPSASKCLALASVSSATFTTPSSFTFLPAESSGTKKP